MGLNTVRKRTKNGDRWYVYAWRGGPCIHKTDGAKPQITPEIMSAALAARGTQRDAGNLDFLIDAYRESPEFERLASETQRDYRLWLNRLSDRFGKAPLEAFNDHRMRGEIIAWRDEWRDRPRSADKATVMTSTVLAWGVEHAILTINVAAKIRHLHKADRSDLIWERRHMRAFTKAPPQLRDALILAGLTGLRLSDLVRLDWSDVGAKAIVMVTQKRKGRAVIPITPTLRRHLEKREWREGPVLRNSRGNGWTANGIGTVFQRNKPEDFDRTIHDLRGNFVTWLAMKGLTDSEIGRIVGWTAGRIADVRSRYVDEARIVVSIAERLSA